MVKRISHTVFATIQKHLYTAFAMIALFALPHASWAQNYVREIDYTLEQPLLGRLDVISFADYLNTVYRFSLGIIGIIAVTLIMFGGMRWISAAGNQQTISTAKEIITSAVIGLSIAILSFSIVEFINPQFTRIGFSVSQITVLPQEQELISLEPCSAAEFKDLKCTNESGVEVNCSDLACGEQGLALDGESRGENCRGVVCGDGEGGCYRGPTDPKDYSCQQTHCGVWAQDCADADYKKYKDSVTKTFETQYASCACDYYEEVAAKNLNIPSTNGHYFTDPLTEDQYDNFKMLCTESETQEHYDTNAGSYGFTGPGAAALKGWNCGFGCNMAGSTSNDDGEFWSNPVGYGTIVCID